jgi:hypothetical protein
MSRTFDAKPATRGGVPLMIGLYGPSGGGKTYSALRLATGITRESGGSIYVVDTESGRARSYADYFSFRHMDFDAPFSSTDYLAAVRAAASEGAGCVIIDSASHEHEGPGGYLDSQAKELERLSKGDEAKADRVRMLSWAKPSGLRQAMINGLVQLNTNLIFCFRAKEKIKPGKDQHGKTVMTELGWMPIAAPALIYEMTANILLLPAAGGVPSWRSEYDGERSMMKLPQQFKQIFADQQPLSEDIGASLARWARGDGSKPKDKPADKPDRWGAYRFADGTLAGEAIDMMNDDLAAAAARGTKYLVEAWGKLPRDGQAACKEKLDTKHKPVALKMDEIPT